jgi:hypothetical protein
MCSYYNYSQTLCIKLLNFNISYPDFMQFHYFVEYPLTWGWKRGLGVKGGPKTWWRQGDFMDIFIGSCFSNCFVCFFKIMFWANLLCMYGNRMHNTLDLGFNLSLHPNSKLTHFQVLVNFVYFPLTSPASLMCMIINCHPLLHYRTSSVPVY